MSELIPESAILSSGNLQKINVTMSEVSKNNWSSNYGKIEEQGRYGFNAFNCRSCGCIGKKNFVN